MFSIELAVLWFYQTFTGLSIFLMKKYSSCRKKNEKSWYKPKQSNVKDLFLINFLKSTKVIGKCTLRCNQTVLCKNSFHVTLADIANRNTWLYIQILCLVSHAWTWKSELRGKDLWIQSLKITVFRLISKIQWNSFNSSIILLCNNP